MDDLRLTALDGMNTIGGSKLLLEFDGHGVLLDFGMNFARTNRYYEEYLRPRTTTGLLDHVIMGTVPDVRGLYRDDLMHPDLHLTGPEIDAVDAVLLSHGHLDHSGDIGFIKPGVPVATSAMTAAIVKASQDCVRNEPGREPVYIARRRVEDLRGAKVLRSRREDLVGRDYFTLDGAPSDDLRRFWGFLPSFELSKRSRAAQLIPGQLDHDLKGLDCELVPVDHSIKGAAAFLIGTSTGSVVYTGDLRMHGLGGAATRDFVSRARSEDTHALVIEGTRVRRSDGQESSRPDATEKEVRDVADAILAGIVGEFAIADFGPRNVERLEIFLDLSRRAHRSLVVTPKDAYLLHAMHTVDQAMPLPGDDMRVYDSPKGSTDRYEEWIVEHRYADSLVTPSEVVRSPGDYLLSFSFFDMKHLIDIRPGGGHYIYSSSEAHNEEQEIDFRRLGEWLKRFAIESHGFEIDADGRPSFASEDGPLHASGHASPEELAKIVREVDPDVLVPVHTENPKWFEDTFGGERKVVLPKQYETVVL
ncbi:MAG: MBL fold metallo-hydrolase [Methanobacteriota archaeon]|nr:MAG: MBL fold metallo-hydrolase [Euryarchaeota archaeon]